MHRSEITIDLGALRRNVRTLLRVLDGAGLWAVVKADGYGHGASDVAGAALGAGATGLCVATIPEGLALRGDYPSERVLVMGPAGSNREVAQARDAGLELAIADDEIPDGVRVHLKLDTGMGRYGLSELPAPPAEVVGLMTHLATADADPDFARTQLERFREAGQSTGYGRRFVADEPTWVGIVPVGYADGFRRDLTGTEVRVAGEPRRVVGTVSMDSFAVELDR